MRLKRTDTQRRTQSLTLFTDTDNLETGLDKTRTQRCKHNPASRRKQKLLKQTSAVPMPPIKINTLTAVGNDH